VRLKRKTVVSFFGRIAVGNRLLQQIFLRCVLVFGLVFSLGAVADNIQAKEFKLNISSQDIEAALNELATQTESLLLFPYDPIHPIQSTPVRGWYTVEQALNLMLQNTDLQGSLTQSGVITISAKSPNKSSEERLMKSKRNLLASVIGFFVGAGGSIHGYAQDSELTKNGLVMEEVVVTAGYRASLRKAMDIKRDEMGFTDSIVAEDIGALPDQNLAEALQRAPGITITRAHGRGEKVSIRNMGPSFTHTTINNLATASGAGREVNFSIFASEVVQSVTVKKSPTASDVEGGVAGTINIKTARPFDYDGFSMAGSAEAAYNDYSEETDPRVSFQVSNTFADGKLGVLFSLAQEDRSYRYDNNYGTGSERTLLDKLGKNDEEGVFRFSDGSLFPDELKGINYIPWLKQRYNVGEENRLGSTLVFDYIVSDSLKLGADVMISQFDVDQHEYTHQTSFSSADNVSNYVVDYDTNILTSGDFTNVRGEMQGKKHDSRNDYQQFALTAEWQLGEWGINGLLGVSEAEYFRTEYTYTYKSPEDTNASYFYDKPFAVPSFSDGVDIYNAGIYTFDKARERWDETEDKKSVFQVDAERMLDLAWIEKIHFGLRYSEKSFISNQYRTSDIKKTLDDVDLDNTAAQDGAVGISGNGFMSGVDNGSSLLGGFQYVPFDRMLDTYFALGYVPELRPQDFYDIEEEIVSAFVETDWAFDIASFPTRLNVGVRYVTTDVTGKANSKVSTDDGTRYDPDENGGTYDNILPSLNMTVEFSDELIGRFSVARVMNRAPLKDLSGYFNVSTATNTITAGNPGLEPLEADQLDIGLEYYFGDESLIAISYFYKDLITFFAESEPVDIQYDFEGDGTTETYEFTQKTNGKGATIQGAEFIFQTPFTFLPSPYDGFGVNFNYSYVESTAGTVSDGRKYPLKDLSKDSLNLALYYEKYGFDARLAYNYRSETLLSSTGIGKDKAPLGQLDFSAGYQITDNIKATLKVINLNDEIYYSYVGGNEDYLNEMSVYGRRISFGIRAKF
jgi:iron complex outermembrane recepter protein